MSEDARSSTSTALTQLLVAFVLTLSAVTAITVWALSSMIPETGLDQLQVVLTNMGTIGGIVSGISLAGFSLLITGNRGIAAMTNLYGNLVQWIFLATYFLTSVSSVACAVVSGFRDYTVMLWVASIWASFMITCVVLTILLINSIFGWMRTTDYLTSSRPC